MYTLLTMHDPRWMKLAALFGKSTKLKKGDNVSLRCFDLEALPLLQAFYKQALLAGAASISYQLIIPEIENYFLKNAQEHQLSFFPNWELEQTKQMNITWAALGRTNNFNQSDIPVERVSARNKVIRPIADERMKNTRWCITYVPTDHDAMLAGMSTEEYFNYYFQACLQNYEAMKKKNRTLKDLMEKTAKVTIRAKDTELSFSIKGIGAQSCHGEFNIPDGEVFTAPVRDSLEGRIAYNVPSHYQGREWSNVRLEFSQGRIVKATCDQGEEVINKLLDTDDGARYIGEFAIGTNPGIIRPAKNILFDEKIFGSFHLTPGRAYEETDNGNKSAIHWDQVKMIAPQYGGGSITFDDAVVMKDGLFVHPELLGLNP